MGKINESTADMKFEDWSKTQDEEMQKMCDAIIEHNRSLVNGHNGLRYIDLDTFQRNGIYDLSHHFAVDEFESYCERNRTSSDYPLGNNRWTHYYNGTQP